MEQIKQLEKRIKELESINKGNCPECGRHIKGYEPPFGMFAPEMFESMRECRIDPGSNHKINCSRRNLVIN